MLPFLPGPRGWGTRVSIQSVCNGPVLSPLMEGSQASVGLLCAVTHEQSSGVSARAAPSPGAQVDPSPGGLVSAGWRPPRLWRLPGLPSTLTYCLPGVGGPVIGAEQSRSEP